MKTSRIRVALVALLGITFAVVLFAPSAFGHTDGGVDEPWTVAMNQETYWELRFGPDTECTKYEPHNGFIPSQYEAAVSKGGSEVRIYLDPPSQITGPHRDNGRHIDISWVMKCDIEQAETTTTTAEATTSTTLPEEPTTTTTSTVPDESTTTTTPTTTTSTTQPPSTSTTSLVTSTTVDPTTSTVPGGSDSTVTTQASSISSPEAPSDPATPDLEELPMTGLPLHVWAIVGLVALASGGFLVRRFSDG